MADRPAKAFVCGHPVAHSRSPLIHGYWINRHCIRGSYESVDVGPDDLAGFMRELRRSGFAGGNITIPHKRAACGLVERVEEAAGIIGAVNTVWFEDGKLCGTNTDWSGFAANLDVNAPGWDRATVATVLGAGGAARGILYALIGRGIDDIRIVNRTQSRAEELAADFADICGSSITIFGLEQTCAGLADADLVVNTTSLGMEGEADFAFDLSGLTPSAVVTDIVYAPLETPLLAQAGRSGFKTVDGLGMLLRQAVPGFEKWFGVRPRVTDELRDLVIADMGHDR